jgi:oxygen-independent coproporphyrinogen-3 oxidase
VERLRAAGVNGINIDLIYGLPHQTVESCLATVDQCVTLKPDRFSVFGYAHVPGFKKHQRRIDATALPGGAERAAQAEAIAARLEDAGYRRIGLDHFARPGDAMAVAGGAGGLHRNFQGYTTDPADTLIGFGASAIGRLPQGYVQNAAVTRDYLAAIGAGRLATARGFALSGDDRLRADLIERLMCDFRVDMDDVCRRHGMARAVLADALPDLDRLAAEGVIHRDGGRIELAADALALVRAVAAAFDAYRSGGAGRTHAPAL